METIKRPAEQEIVIPIKRSKVEDELNILDFSDCVLLKILSFLHTYDLYTLSKSCNRFKYLIQEKKLWKKVNLLDHQMCSKKFEFFFKNVHNNTDSILVSGISKKEKTLTFCQFVKLNNICNNITILAIENQYINSDEIRLKHFPETLKELSLKGTHIYGKQSFLQDAHVKLTNLHTLILANCKWFHEHSLLALSKLKNLENLSLFRCANLNDSVAYMSITAKFGFRKLRRIDARRTSIGDQFLKCFHCVKTLREIYLEAPDRRQRLRHSRPILRPGQSRMINELRRINEAHNAVLYPPGGPIEEPEGAARQGDVRERYFRAHGLRDIGVQHVFGANGANAMVFSALPPTRTKKEKKKPPLSHPRDPTFNCLDEAADCSLTSCSVMPTSSEQNNCAESRKRKLERMQQDEREANCAVCEVRITPNAANPVEISWRQAFRCDLGNENAGSPSTSRETGEVEHNSPGSNSLTNSPTPPNSNISPQISNNSSPKNPSPLNSTNGSPNLSNFNISPENIITIGQTVHVVTEKEDYPEPKRIKIDEQDKNKPSTSKSLPSDLEDDVNEPETLYCDDVSDTEDEDDILYEDAAASAAVIELELLQPVVTDAGVQWFMGARPDPLDPPGEPSMLFQPPFIPQVAPVKNEESNSTDQPGPSGYDPTLLPPPSPTRRSNVTLPPDVIAGPSNLPSDPPSDPAADPPADPPADPAADPAADPPSDPSAQEDQGLQEIAELHRLYDLQQQEEVQRRVPPDFLQIRNEVERRLQLELLQQQLQQRRDLWNVCRNELGMRIIRSGLREVHRRQQNLVEVEPQQAEAPPIAEAPPFPPPAVGIPPPENPAPPHRQFPRVRTPPPGGPPPRIHGHMIIQNPRRRGQNRRRDLRVIIERLDPGVHIVYDGGEARDYTTRLKVLVCRGYRHITDLTLRSLIDLHLEYLDVRGTRVTAAGVVDFLLLNPDCHLLHDTQVSATSFQKATNQQK